jgi:hypothetical protein
MSQSSKSPGVGEPDVDTRDAPIVVLLSAWWKNPFLWMALGMGTPGTIMAAGGGERLHNVTPVIATLTVLLAGVAHFSLRARLEIRPDGFREDFAFWRTIEYRWAEVSRFAVLKDPEAEDSIGFLVLKNGRATGESIVLMGAYTESVEALTDRLNDARDKALGPAATGTPKVRPRISRWHH